MKFIGNHGLGIFRCGDVWPHSPSSRSNNGSLALVSCLSGGYKFASVPDMLGHFLYNPKVDLYTI